MTTNLAALNSPHLLAHGSVGQKPSMMGLGSLLHISKAEIKVLAGLSPCLETLGKICFQAPR